METLELIGAAFVLYAVVHIIVTSYARVDFFKRNFSSKEERITWRKNVFSPFNWLEFFAYVFFVLKHKE